MGVIHSWQVAVQETFLNACRTLRLGMPTFVGSYEPDGVLEQFCAAPEWPCCQGWWMPICGGAGGRRPLCALSRLVLAPRCYGVVLSMIGVATDATTHALAGVSVARGGVYINGKHCCMLRLLFAVEMTAFDA